ncbi:MAG: bifunctional diaminohydroxyphosphoribosylaminopyrimidine deaminase/5-amino-6-(5-phosphoribosylamino)uracil reductase RibD [Candidatus Hydrogenedens sp.]|nr:bifunctional diaminohydroxyphosphoribosylaminopyrimidine deaminase/5-amino-6-(5-phosphoribosylamino)uracil reductase RibD [Candidatus Hydrogenedens sp.]
MRRALELAERGRLTARPNPMVGCVIVRDGEVIGEGYHEVFGGPHAEVNAVNAAGGEIAGATVYVTLEPCAHHGKTPPCADFLIDHKPARVVAAMQDPNPMVSGAGADKLRAAGIRVDVGCLEDQAHRLNEVFVKYTTTQLPFVIAKCAMSLDGKIATRTGHSQWVTGESARRAVHELRNQVDAILVGSRTVMMDDPSLTTRLPQGGGRDPIRVILDAGEYLDEGRKLFHIESDAPTWVAVTQPREYPGAAEMIRVGQGPGGVDIRELLEILGARGITSLLIEGGGTTLASAFEARMVDKVLFFIAPKIVGGSAAVTPVEGAGIERMDDAIMLRDMKVAPIGEDWMVEAYVE